MAKRTQHTSETICLIRITPGDEFVAYEVTDEKLRDLGRARPLAAAEIRQVIEELAQRLPEPERQAFEVKIRTAGMI